MKKRDMLIADDFILETEEGRALYHEYAQKLPIIDYHCHLSPSHISSDHRYRNIAEVWLGGDHYKWRAMRWNGVEERFCTGDASDREKFQKWAETVAQLLRNPLYHWTHLELKRYFGIGNRVLGPDTAEYFWNECNRQIALPEFSARGLMRRSRVVLVCTTDDPTDSLEHHRAIAEDESFDIHVLPTWRPDKGMAVENPAAFVSWVERLEERTDGRIRTFNQFMDALKKRHDFFHQAGCRLSDHGLETVYAADYRPSEIAAIFRKVRGGMRLSPGQALRFKSAMLFEFGVMDHARNWTQQFHLGVLRNNNSRCFGTLGPDTGFDAIGDFEIGRPLVRFLDRLNQANQLAKTIVYNVNPRDNALVASALGCFQDGLVPGKMQMGSGWWFLDQKDGMERQIEALSQLGLLSRFVGMLTDSRSFLSYTRHEYFRRILCNILGKDMARGLIPRDMALVGAMVTDICYGNAARYFGFTLPPLVR